LALFEPHARDGEAQKVKVKTMPSVDEMLIATMAGIDAANARDPNTVEVDGQREPAELVYDGA